MNVVSQSWWNGVAANPPTGAGGYGVSKYFARPTYQNGFTSSSSRSVPDVAEAADPSDGIELCQADDGGCPDGHLNGGTSMAAPQMAIETAELDQALGTNIGNFNSAVYPVAADPNTFTTASNMGSDFPHVGLGAPNWNYLYIALKGLSIGAVSPSVSTAITTPAPADGSTPGLVRVQLFDANGFPVQGQSVAIAPSSSTAVVSGSPAVTDVQGIASFGVTDSVTESFTVIATDMSDGVTLASQPAMTFFAPSASGAQIYGGPAEVNNDGTSQATITVYLENSLSQPASGKTVTLSDGSGGAVITPAGSTTPGTTAVTNSAGNAVFTATDINAEAVDFTATDVTDGNLAVPGSVSVNFAPTTATCPTTLPTPASGISVTAFATGISYNTEGEIFPGNFTENSCTTGAAPAFNTAGDAYVADTNNGTIHVLPPSGGALSAANQLPDASFPPDTVGQLVFGPDGSLYAGLANFSTDVSNPEIVQLDPSTGATIRVVADSSTGLPDCPYVMAVDPLSGDLFTDDECSGYAASDQISRISDPSGTSPTVYDYYNTGSCNLGLAFAPDGTLYLANCNGEVDAISGTNTATPTESTVSAVSGTPFSVAVTGTNSSGDATSLDVFTLGGDVDSIDLTQSPPAVSTIATGTTFFYITATSASGCAYGSIPGSIVEVGPPTCASSPSTTSNPELSLAGPGVMNPAAGSSITFNAQLGNVASPTGTPILFTVSGANPQVKLVDANSAGSASFSYSAIHPGTDTVTATAAVGSTNLASNLINVTWVAGLDTSSVSLNGSQEIGPLGQSATFDANVSDVSQNPPGVVDGATVDVTVGSQSCTITTGGNGSGSCAITPSTPGLLAVTATYSGSSTLTASTASGSFFSGGPSTAPPAGAPTITSAATDTVASGASFTYPVTATGTPTPAITLASGSTLPSGVTLTDDGNGNATLAGTSSVVAGTYHLTIQAANGVSPNATQAFTLTVTRAPAITSAASDTVASGASFTYPVTATGTPTPAITLASGSTLPSGVTLTDDGNGNATLAGTSSVVAGTYHLTIQAANGVSPNCHPGVHLDGEPGNQGADLHQWGQ